MNFRNNSKYKQTLNIQIEQSPQVPNPQQSPSHLSDSDHASDPQNEDSSHSSFQQDQHEDRGQQQSLSQQRSQNGLNDQNHQDHQFQRQEANHLIQNHSQYNSGQNHQDYLILEKQCSPESSSPKKSSFLYPNPNQSHSLPLNKLQHSQKDPQVQKIIQDVLFKRKQKQKQKQLIQNILSSQKKSHQISSIFTYQPKPINLMKLKLNENLNTLNEDQNLKDNYQLLTRCKDLESKIKLLAKKKDNIEKTRKQKQQKLKEKEKKSQNHKTKKQLSLQKLQKRLQKALKLNLNLSKRVKLQKSQLSSILSLSHCTANSKSNINASIDQQSTIKHVQNSSRFNQSIDKNDGGSHRSGVLDKLLFKVAQSPSVIYQGSVSRQSDILRSSRKESCKDCHKRKESGNQSKRSQNEKKFKIKFAKGDSPAKYKSPILQFNSYLIDDSSEQKGTKQNIYIEDDMIEQVSESLSREIQKEGIEQHQKQEAMKEERRQKENQLKELMAKYQKLSEEQKNWSYIIEKNGTTIKDYENHEYQQVLC